ncbi:MAG TPA: hypothetical protein VK466_03030 [Terriglobales bacterium]|nr:hypothetical protein [Terriglobales bacterium]
MLEARPNCALQAGTGRKPLIVSLPAPLHESTVLLTPAALGVVGGLYSFFHGFSILQQQRPLPVSLPAKSNTHASRPVEEVAATPKREARTEIIQLSPESNTTSSVLMTQQGKIAAALLKAGMANPATWTDDPTHAGVRVAAPPNPSPSLASIEAKVSVVVGPAASGFQFPSPALRAEQQSAKRKAMLLIWGGPALALACVYFLAAHLGWL